MIDLDRPIVFFDLETTGTDKNNDRIVEIACVKIYTDGRRVEYEQRFNPGVSIPDGASKVHGIYDKDVIGKPRFEEKADLILKSLSGCDLGGYNIVSFDIPMIQAEFERCGLNLDMDGVNIVDPFVIFCEMFPRTLEGAYRYFTKKEISGAHTAIGDVNSTIEVLEGQMAKYGISGNAKDVWDKFRDPDALDFEGKLVRDGEQVRINFGQHKGKLVADVPPSYIDWMLKNNVIGSEAVKYLKG